MIVYQNWISIFDLNHLLRLEESVLTEDDLNNQSYTEYEAGGYSPKLLQYSDLEPDTLVYDPEDDLRRLQFARLHLEQTGQAKVCKVYIVLL